MSGSLRDVARVATEVSEGHLGVDFTPRSDRDELGHAVQGMLHSLRTVTARLEMSANEVNVAGEEFARAADDSGKAANNVAENSTSLANAAVQASRDVEDLQGRLSEVSLAATEQVASATQAESRLGSMVKEIEEAAGEGEIMARTARDGTIAAARATEIMASIQAQTESARQQIVALDEKGRQIGDIVETIAAIAAQTNLLALNAAIEAARAGQQGRGFAVVAEEVRKLAEQSGAATDSISSLIEEVRSTVMRTVEAIMATTEQVTKGTAGAEETRSALIEIESTVASVASQLDRIRADSAEAAQAMANVSRAAVDNRRLLDEAQSRSQDVAQTVDKVASISQQTAASSEQLNASSEEVNASAQELRKMAAELHSITGLLSAKEEPSLKAAA
jgi:methyl-accepting chemotaxis protein